MLLAENFHSRLKDFILFMFAVPLCPACLPLFFCVGHASVILREWQALAVAMADACTCTSSVNLHNPFGLMANKGITGDTRSR